MASEVFQAVLDESGYEAADSKYPDDVFVFAGYIGKVVDWANFTHAWQPLIESHPELEDAKFVKKLMRWHGSKSDDRAVALMKAVTDNAGARKYSMDTSISGIPQGHRHSPKRR